MIRAAAALVLLPSAALAGDVIVLTDGRTLGTQRAADPPTAADFAASNITVTDENLEAVLYRLPGVPSKQTLPRAQVKAVRHDPATIPPDLADGLALLAKGSFEEARTKLSLVAHSTMAPTWAQAEAAFRRAESYVTQGDADAAVRELAGFAEDRPKSRYALDARRARARMLLEAGRDGDAKSAYAALAEMSGVTDDEAAGAKFAALWIEARPALAAADAAALTAAAKSFSELRSTAPVGGTAAARCEVARVACLAAMEKADETAVAALIGRSDDPFVLAVAHTAAADALRRRGTAKSDRAALEEAQERYLRVALLYRDADLAGDLVAAAWFHAAELFVELKPSDAAGAAAAKARARREYEDLVRRFPRSEWAKRAKAAVAALQ